MCYEPNYKPALSARVCADYLIGWIKGSGYVYTFAREIKSLNVLEKRGLEHMNQVYFGRDCLDQDSYL